jgi:hypothetical protein
LPIALSPKLKTGLQGITDHSNPGIPDRKKTGLITRLSCKTYDFLIANHNAKSAVYPFFTGQ